MIDIALSERIVGFLNELIAIDPVAVKELINHRVKCNQALANHPSVQVTEDSRVGIIGILNGICGTGQDGFGAVSVIIDDEGNVIESYLIKERLT